MSNFARRSKDNKFKFSKNCQPKTVFKDLIYEISIFSPKDELYLDFRVRDPAKFSEISITHLSLLDRKVFNLLSLKENVTRESEREENIENIV